MISHQPPQTGELSAAQQLAVLEELRAEVESANASLTEDRIDLFQGHVSRLQELTSSLLLWQQDPDNHPTATTNIEVLAAHHRLSQANRRLAALLRRFQRTAQLLSRHYMAAGGDETPKRSNWSAEI